MLLYNGPRSFLDWGLLGSAAGMHGCAVRAFLRVLFRVIGSLTTPEALWALSSRRNWLSLATKSSDVESDDYSESARSYELGKASDFACARPRPDFSAFLCLWRKVTIGWEMRPVRLVLQNIRNFFSQNEWCLPFTKIVGPVRAAIRRKVQVRKVREKPGGRLFTTFTDVLRPLTSLTS